MKIKFWGVRGSIPVPGETTLHYGGNTTCIELMGDRNQCVILDAGTGIRPLGMDLMRRFKPLPPIHLFITHTHWDHLQGFPFFVPSYIPGTQMHIRGPVHFAETQNLQNIFEMQMRYEFFPISNAQLGASIDYTDLKEMKMELDGMTVQSQFANHPILSLAYRFTSEGRSFVFTGDHEPYQNLFEKGGKSGEESPEDDLLFGDVGATVDNANQRFVQFIRGANILVIDCQYTPEEYQTNRKNWGHSSWDYCLNWMKEASIERMVLTHHDPMRTDDALNQIKKDVDARAKEMGLNPENIMLAKEGLELNV